MADLMTIDYAPFIAAAKTAAREQAPKTRVFGAWPQRHRVIHDLLMRLARHAAETGVHPDDVDQHFYDAESIVDAVWNLGASREASENEHGPLPDDADVASRILTERARLWRRRNPAAAYNEGYKSKDFFCITPNDELTATIAYYLSKPWLRHPVLDWALLDISITSETCGFGEQVKRSRYNQPDKGLGTYISYQGALDKLKPNPSLRLSLLLCIRNFAWKWALYFSIWYGLSFLPSGIPSPASLVGIISTAAITLASIFVWRLITRAACAKAAAAHDQQTAVMLAMLDAWKSLDGPALNPTRVKAAMQKAADLTADLGAVWDNSAWALIDRVIAVAPVVWVVHLDDE
jgi:hypothetical protein